jgi:predicted aminopeptidase
MKQTRRIWIGGIVFFVLITAGCSVSELISYGLMQGKGQLKVLQGAEPVDYWLQSDNLSASKKEKLKLIEDIRKYAFDSLGLQRNKNYTKMYNDEDNPALWVVSASAPFALEPMTWSFPLIGTFSYKGFFEKEKALELVAELEEDGMDVSLRTVGGWSTLGWFKDPVMASMLRRSEGDLANLIIHELSHATIFVKNDTELNENIATFIGDKGAEQFLAFRFGPDSEELSSYLLGKEDYEKFSLYWLAQAQKLDSLYKGMEPLSLAEKNSMKNQIIKEMVDGLDSVPFNRASRYANYFDELPNNNFFINFRRYRSRQSLFEEEFQDKFDGDLSAIIAHWKKSY